MKKKSKINKVSIEDFYAVKLASLWQGLKQEHISFWALLLYFFFEYVRPQSIYPAIDILPWAQIMLIMALIAAFLDRSVKGVSCVANKLIIFFFVIVVLSGFMAFKPLVSWSYSVNLINWVAVYFLLINIVNTEKRMFLFLLAYLLFSFKMSQHGFFSWASRGFSFKSWGLIGTPGWFNNSGEFAIQMLIFGSLSAAFVLALKDRWGRYKKWFFYFMPFTAVMTVLGASSRGSQLALLVIGLLLMLRLKVGLKVFILMAVIIFIGYSLVPEEQLQRLSDMGNDNTSLIRFAYWEYGLQVVKDHPLLGVGYGNWKSYANYSVPGGIYHGASQLPHNIYVEVAAESGLLGFLGFLFLVIYAFVLNARSRRIALQKKHKLYCYITYGLDMGLVGYLVAGTFVSVFYYPFFWVQISLIVALYSIINNQVGLNNDTNAFESNGINKR